MVKVLESIEIEGLRGFSKSKEIFFAKSNGKPGSGLTIITGPNNSGKTTIIEAFRARQGNTTSFPIGMRNQKTDYVKISYKIEGEEIKEVLESTNKGTSESIRKNFGAANMFFVLPSRRTFNPYFSGGGNYSRDAYYHQIGLESQRNNSLNQIAQQFFEIQTNPEKKELFNKTLNGLIGESLEWSIDQSDQGQYFLKITKLGGYHSSDGLGEGLVSLFTILVALLESNPQDIIVIDEPELSLHPSLQKKLSHLFSSYTADRQIIIATHSPYFIDLAALLVGAEIIRTSIKEEEIEISQLSEESKGVIEELAFGNLGNPHIFGTNAKEIFFLNDGVVLLEGQEDTVLLPKILEEIGIEIGAEIFGWGVGGAGNMKKLCGILKDIGFKSVFGILDGDQEELLEVLKAEYPNYGFEKIPADDIRTKPEVPKRLGKIGLLDEGYNVRDDLLEPTKEVFNKVKSYFEAT